MILFYGTFVPLQGIEHIIRAAKILTDTEFRFRLVGDGQTRQSAVELAEHLGLRNVEFPGLMTQRDLVDEMARSSIVLGVFGTSKKANRVIPHKLFEALACGRPVLTGDTEAIREGLEGDEVATCAVGDPYSLAHAISELMADRDRLDSLAAAGLASFQSSFAREPQSRRLLRELELTMRAA